MEEAVTAELPDWLIPPRPSGWESDDLDNLPQAPLHTELIDGALIFRLLPQRSWHSRLVEKLHLRSATGGPLGFEAAREMTVRLDKKSRPEPDVLVTTATYDPDRTWFAPEDERGSPTVHTDELDTMTSSYVPTGIHRGRLKVSVPFPLYIDLDALVP
ncbi:Uma2 family endonuclease [Streptomyces sp. NPDC004111]|uniref:Uma2 family endonuclease n=1 Tax=Streptomyces sp. NPDC004111 TaxID=3364690 RepID=UPI00367DD501